jgi:hypothetical protein
MYTLKISNGDILLDDIGRPLIVENLDKLSQTVHEILSIDIQENGFGAGLGQTGLAVQTEIYSAFGRWKELQDKSKQERSDLEKFDSIQNIFVDSHQTEIRFEVDVLSKEGSNTIVRGGFR